MLCVQKSRRGVISIMNSLLIFIGENEKFDKSATIGAIMNLNGTSDLEDGDLIESVFRCMYSNYGTFCTVRFSKDLETISVQPVNDASLDFILQLQSKLTVNLTVIDTNYSFDIPLRITSTMDKLNEFMSIGFKQRI